MGSGDLLEITRQLLFLIGGHEFNLSFLQLFILLLLTYLAVKFGLNLTVYSGTDSDLQCDGGNFHFRKLDLKKKPTKLHNCTLTCVL